MARLPFIDLHLCPNQSRVRVRRASISEPSDTDPELRTLDPSPAGWFVQQHRELELLASFRERFGCDWLQYRSHLETMGSPPLATIKTPALGTPPLDAQSLETARSPPAIGEDTKESPEKVSEEGREELEPHEEEREEQEREEGSREDLGEEEEQEQKAVEGESPANIGALGYPSVRRTGEARLGRRPLTG